MRERVYFTLPCCQKRASQPPGNGSVLNGSVGSARLWSRRRSPTCSCACPTLPKCLPSDLLFWDTLQQAGISIFLIKLQRQGILFGVKATEMERARAVLERTGFQVTVKPHRVMVSVFA